jgi:hypothetical protein
MLGKQTVCLRQLGGNRAEEVRLGRWLSNTNVCHEELINNIIAKSYASTNSIWGLKKFQLILEDYLLANLYA